MKRLPLLILLLLVSLGGPVAAADKAPPLLVSTLDGQNFDLASLRGHPVIVNFWATWCVPCRAEMPALSDYYLHHKADGVAMIGLSVDNARDLPNVKKLAATVSYPIANARDAQQNGFPPANALPMTYIIDAQGNVRARLTPDSEELTEKTLTALMQPLLKAR
jgi:cytochrome c biogenesis protein CcmG/thiol:disulfide interchange protein DsbE